MKTLFELYGISSPSKKETKMVNYIEARLQELGAVTKRDKMNNLYATKGESESYPCVVAHTDEVHYTKTKDFKVYRIGDMLFGADAKKNEFIGIGADDKNGIWVALKCFEDFDFVKGAFFVAEEIGCVGSASADMSFFDDCRFVLQCDRRGGGDFITNASGVELSDKSFTEQIPLGYFGYKETKGAMTDVMQLKENGLDVACANISCGYYNPHTENEYTVWHELQNCYDLVAFIFKNITDVCHHDNIFYKKQKWDYYYDRGGYYNGYSDIQSSYEELEEYYEASIIEIMESPEDAGSLISYLWELYDDVPKEHIEEFKMLFKSCTGCSVREYAKMLETEAFESATGYSGEGRI